MILSEQIFGGRLLAFREPLAQEQTVCPEDAPGRRHHRKSSSTCVFRRVYAGLLRYLRSPSSPRRKQIACEDRVEVRLPPLVDR
jgi:hypothetical protein